MTKEIAKIAWLFPDTLYLHGERGNVLALKKMCEAAGLNPQVDKIDFDTVDFDPMAYDIMVCGPGEMCVFSEVIEYLAPKKDLLRAFIDFGHPLLVTGTSVGIWGKQIKRSDGTTIPGLGIINLEVSENEAVYGDDLFFQTQYDGCHTPIFGSQIQMMDITLGSDLEPFGQMYYGYGNNGGNQEEGALVDHAIFTNTLGPMLILNPWLAKAMVTCVLKKKALPIPEDFMPNMALERDSMASKVALTLKKESRLTNCPPLSKQISEYRDGLKENKEK